MQGQMDRDNREGEGRPGTQWAQLLGGGCDVMLSWLGEVWDMGGGASAEECHPDSSREGLGQQGRVHPVIPAPLKGGWSHPLQCLPLIVEDLQSFLSDLYHCLMMIITDPATVD